MRKAKIIQLAKHVNLIRNYSKLRRFLLDAALEHQVQAFRYSCDFTRCVYHARCYAVAFVYLVLLKNARKAPGFYRYLDRISGGALTHDLDERSWVWGPEGLLFPAWLVGRVLVVRRVARARYEEGDLQVSVVVNSRFQVMMKALSLDKYEYVSTFQKQIFDRFAQIWLSREPFPANGLPKERLLESELKALFRREGGFYELS